MVDALIQNAASGILSLHATFERLEHLQARSGGQMEVIQTLPTHSKCLELCALGKDWDYGPPDCGFLFLLKIFLFTYE